MSESASRALIEAALEDLDLVPCPMCHGEQYAGHETLRVRCPMCRGFGVVPNEDSDERE